MSSRCQCPFSGPADTILGSHRDPITSEKCWLDFQVRELSRVAAGKARGQEAVWRSQCKPVWWDSVCPHPWKNPTANPKDSKDTLKVKFECLVQHLRREGQVPTEMEAEIGLWEAGRVSEMFLMTSFSSLLGQASNLHSVLGDTIRKMEETNISISPCILTSLRNCLSACVDTIKIRSLATQKSRNSEDTEAAKSTSCSGRKRVHSESVSDLSQLSNKRFKRSPNLSSPSSSLSSVISPISSPSSSSVSPSTSSPQSPQFVQVVSNIALNPEQNKVVLAALRKQLERKSTKTAAVTLPDVQPPCKTTCHKGKSSKKLSCHKKASKMLDRGRVAAAVSVQATPAASQPATISENAVLHKQNETSEFPDFLSLDLVENEEIEIQDLDFFDNLLKEKSPEVVISTNSNSVATECIGLNSTSKMERSPVQNVLTSLKSPDPFLPHAIVASDISEMSAEMVAGDRHLSCEASPVSFGTALGTDVGDTVPVEIELVSDSGYESTSPTSHRSSLDTDVYSYSHADLSSPDLEAYLNAL